MNYNSVLVAAVFVSVTICIVAGPTRTNQSSKCKTIFNMGDQFKRTSSGCQQTCTCSIVPGLPLCMPLICPSATATTIPTTRPTTVESSTAFSTTAIPTAAKDAPTVPADVPTPREISSSSTDAPTEPTNATTLSTQAATGYFMGNCTSIAVYLVRRFRA